MSEEKKETIDGELSNLLDTALADFGRTRNTDDELDSMMADMDAEAAQKAARNFDNMMKTLNEKTQAEGQQRATTAKAEITPEERRAAENFQNMLKALVEAEEKAMKEQPMEGVGEDYDQASAQAFLAQMKTLSEQDPAEMVDESHLDPLMNLVSSLFAKDLMYPPIKQLYDSFPEYLEKHPELDAETRKRYNEQIRIIGSICAEYEKETSDDEEMMKKRLETISTLMMELQGYGYPPEELVGTAPPGWGIDPDTGLPRVEDVSKAAESCSLM